MEFIKIQEKIKNTVNELRISLKEIEKTAMHIIASNYIYIVYMCVYTYIMYVCMYVYTYIHREGVGKKGRETAINVN